MDEATEERMRIMEKIAQKANRGENA